MSKEVMPNKIDSSKIAADVESINCSFSNTTRSSIKKSSEKQNKQFNVINAGVEAVSETLQTATGAEKNKMKREAKKERRKLQMEKSKEKDAEMNNKITAQVVDDESANLETKFNQYLQKSSHDTFSEAQVKINEFVAKRLRKYEKKLDDSNALVEEVVHMFRFLSEEQTKKSSNVVPNKNVELMAGKQDFKYNEQSVLQMENEHQSGTFSGTLDDHSLVDGIGMEEGRSQPEVYRANAQFPPINSSSLDALKPGDEYQIRVDETGASTSSSVTSFGKFAKDSMKRAEKNKRKREAKKEKKRNLMLKPDNVIEDEEKEEDDVYFDFHSRFLLYLNEKAHTPISEAISKAKEFADRRLRKFIKMGSSPNALKFYNSLNVDKIEKNMVHMLVFLSEEQGKTSFITIENEFIKIMTEESEDEGYDLGPSTSGAGQNNKAESSDRFNEPGTSGKSFVQKKQCE